MPPSLPEKSCRESATRTYLHLAAYAGPSLFFVVFASLVLVPKMEKIWSIAGEDAAKSSWVLGICVNFTIHFQWIVGGLTALFVVFENAWPGWNRFRSRVVRLMTWCLTFSVILGMTWMAVTALLITPRAIVKAQKDAAAGISHVPTSAQSKATPNKP